jgi:hypothetical protein
MDVGVRIVLIKNYVIEINHVYHVTAIHLHLMKKVNIGVVEIQKNLKIFSNVLIKSIGLCVIVDIVLTQY